MVTEGGGNRKSVYPGGVTTILYTHGRGPGNVNAKGPCKRRPDTPRVRGRNRVRDESVEEWSLPKEAWNKLIVNVGSKRVWNWRRSGRRPDRIIYQWRTQRLRGVTLSSKYNREWKWGELCRDIEITDHGPSITWKSSINTSLIYFMNGSQWGRFAISVWNWGSQTK